MDSAADFSLSDNNFESIDVNESQTTHLSIDIEIYQAESIIDGSCVVEYEENEEHENPQVYEQDSDANFSSVNRRLSLDQNI